MNNWLKTGDVVCVNYYNFDGEKCKGNGNNAAEGTYMDRNRWTEKLSYQYHNRVSAWKGDMKAALLRRW